MERLTLWAPCVIPGKIQQVHYISVKLPLNKGVLNYTILCVQLHVIATPCDPIGSKPQQ